MTDALKKQIADAFFSIIVMFSISMIFFELRDLRLELARLQSDPSCEWEVKAIDGLRGKESP